MFPAVFVVTETRPSCVFEGKPNQSMSTAQCCDKGEIENLTCLSLCRNVPS